MLDRNKAVRPVERHGDHVADVGLDRTHVSWITSVDRIQLTIVENTRVEGCSIVPDCNRVLAPLPAYLELVAFSNRPVQIVQYRVADSFFETYDLLCEVCVDI